ncbi:MAG TPA: BON domain-containing protein [Castellaniella sp.]|uniref:BON domain-containing protein n=1 Tax=Castellaniella sp. TaxID=1955812 RepID=UPI002F105544
MTASHLTARTLFRCLLVTSALLPLTGCALALVGGAAAGTAVIATDRRTAGEQVDDQTIELRVSNDLGSAFGDNSRIAGMAYEGRLLLVGDVPTDADRQKAESLARAIPKVKSVDNYIRVGDLTPLSVRTNDTWITAKVKTELAATKDVPFRTIKVTTERGVVYLMGKVTADEAERAGIVASSVTGVNKVVKLFQIVARETILINSGTPAPVTDSSSKGTAAPSAPAPAAAPSGGAQTMPVH